MMDTPRSDLLLEKQPSHAGVMSASSSLSEKLEQPPQSPLPDPTVPRPPSPSSFKPSSRLYLAFVALCVLTLMVAFDGTSLSVALPIIADKLHGTALEAFWAGTGFLLSSTVFQPTFASFSHIFGRMPLIITAVTFFFVGTMVAGFSQEFGQLLAGRVIQGIGGGGVIAMTEVVMTDLIPLRDRPKWSSIIGAMWAVGSVGGPLIGGAFSEKVTWRWLLWINLPFIGVGGVLIPLFLRLNSVPGGVAEKLKRIDWSGSVIFVASTTSLLIPLTWGGVMYEWQSWHTIVPLVLGVVGLIGFGFYEIYVTKEPMIRLSVFANRTVNIGYFNTTLHGLILWCLLYYQPLWFETVKNFSPVLTGVALFPATFTVAPMAIITGIAISYFGKYRWSIWLGWTTAVLGLGLLILLDIGTATVKWVFIDLVSGIGLGILFPSLQIQIQAASSNKDMAFAVAMFSFFRAFGQTLGVAIGGVVFQNQMTQKLMAYPQFAAQAHDLAKDAAALVETVKTITNPVDQLALKTAYTESIRTIYIVICALAGLGLLTSLLLPTDYELSTELETEQGLTSGRREKDISPEEGRA